MHKFTTKIASWQNSVNKLVFRSAYLVFFSIGMAHLVFWSAYLVFLLAYFMFWLAYFWFKAALFAFPVEKKYACLKKKRLVSQVWLVLQVYSCWSVRTFPVYVIVSFGVKEYFFEAKKLKKCVEIKKNLRRFGRMRRGFWSRKILIKKITK